MNRVEPGAAVFEIVDAGLAESRHDLFGLWTASDVAPSPEASFDASIAAAESASLWRVNLPADPPLAQAELDQAEAQLTATERALEQASDRLVAVAQQAGAGASFTITRTGGPQPVAEVELLKLLQSAGLDETVVSFGLRERVTERIEPITRQFQVLVTRSQKLVGHDAVVVTTVGERIIAQTSVSWGGDAHTTWRSDVDPQQVVLHQRAVTLAVASRTALLRTLIVASQGAIAIMVRLSMPGGVLLALPAAWRFVTQVLAELGIYSERRGAILHGH
jgi:hypothetical protein